MFSWKLNNLHDISNFLNIWIDVSKKDATITYKRTYLNCRVAALWQICTKACTIRIYEIFSISKSYQEWTRFRIINKKENLSISNKGHFELYTRVGPDTFWPDIKMISRKLLDIWLDNRISGIKISRISVVRIILISGIWPGIENDRISSPTLLYTLMIVLFIFIESWI